jgi:hypothetical protein
VDKNISQYKEKKEFNPVSPPTPFFYLRISPVCARLRIWGVGIVVTGAAN